MPRLTFLFDAGLDPQQYEAQWGEGRSPDRLPYGSEHAPEGWSFEIAARPTPARLQRISRILQGRLGFNLVHALVNRRALRAAEFIYCHTEVEYLAAAAVLPRRGQRRPILAGQTIWLFRRFEELSPLKRRIYRRLLRRVDIFVSNARPNQQLGERLVPSGHHQYIPFGISQRFNASDRAPGRPDVLGVGNDVARDWETFATAVDGLGVEVRVASKKAVTVDGKPVSALTDGVAELIALYRTSRLVVVAVVENSHASGVTTLLEAVAARVPAIATRTGGLDEYFDDAEVTFVPPRDARALQQAIRDRLTDPEGSAAMAAAAHNRAETDGYWNEVYWRRVVEVLAAARDARA